MSLVPPEALEKLICASCKKYLSVLPVSVHSDKAVTCGRQECLNYNGSKGTASILYEMVANKLKFPCINRFEGCRQTLEVVHIKTHEENDCLSKWVQCPLCLMDMDSSYVLLHHFKKNHEDAALKKTAFWIDLNQCLEKKIFFYCKDDIFVNVGYKYTSSTHRINLYFKIYGEQKNLMHKFKLYSVHNELPYETDDINSFRSGLSDGRSLVIDLSNHCHATDILFCKFKMWEAINNHQASTANNKLLTRISPPPAIINGSDTSALMKFKFGQINQLKEDLVYFSDFKYWVGNKLWQLAIERLIDDTGVPHLAVYLYQHFDNGSRIGLCKVFSTVSLISSVNTDLNVTRNINASSFKMMDGWRNFLNWRALVDRQGGYINENSIQFDVLIEISPP